MLWEKSQKCLGVYCWVLKSCQNIVIWQSSSYMGASIFLKPDILRNSFAQFVLQFHLTAGGSQTYWSYPLRRIMSKLNLKTWKCHWLCLFYNFTLQPVGHRHTDLTHYAGSCPNSRWVEYKDLRHLQPCTTGRLKKEVANFDNSLRIVFLKLKFVLGSDLEIIDFKKNI